MLFSPAVEIGGLEPSVVQTMPVDITLPVAVQSWNHRSEFHHGVQREA